MSVAAALVALLIGLGCIGSIVAIVLLIVRLLTGDVRSEIKPTSIDKPDLRAWHREKSKPVNRPRDPRTKHCLANLGQEVAIRYKGREVWIVPVRVYTKPKYRKTYVDAISDGEQRTYNVDEMELL